MKDIVSTIDYESMPRVLSPTWMQRGNKFCRIDSYGTKYRYLNGKLHREDGPAVEFVSGSKKWYFNGLLHREDGPAVEHFNGDKEWWVNGVRHRADGPAIERSDSTKHWYLNDKRHRVDGPAVERINGDKEWWVNGKLHREDGPAVELCNGHRELWFNNYFFFNIEYLIDAFTAESFPVPRKQFKCYFINNREKWAPETLIIDGVEFTRERNWLWRLFNWLWLK